MSESDKEENETGKKVEKPVLAWSDVLLIIHYSTFIIYTFHTQQGGSPDLLHKEGVCMCVCVPLHNSWRVTNEKNKI